MAKLPLHPLILIPAYLLLACVATIPMLGGQHYALGVTGALGLQVAWAIQALAFASKEHVGDGRIARITQLATARFVVLTLLVCLAVVALYYGYLNWGPTSETSVTAILKALSSICEGLAVVLFFAVLWISAAGICDAEESGKAPAHRVVGTFLLLVYVVIGAPFIFTRLKRLAHQPEDRVAA